MNLRAKGAGLATAATWVGDALKSSEHQLTTIARHFDPAPDRTYRLQEHPMALLRSVHRIQHDRRDTRVYVLSRDCRKDTGRDW